LCHRMIILDLCEGNGDDQQERTWA
jgi:hypothetical protein